MRAVDVRGRSQPSRRQASRPGPGWTTRASRWSWWSACWRCPAPAAPVRRRPTGTSSRSAPGRPAAGGPPHPRTRAWTPACWRGSTTRRGWSFPPCAACWSSATACWCSSATTTAPPRPPTSTAFRSPRASPPRWSGSRWAIARSAAWTSPSAGCWPATCRPGARHRRVPVAGVARAGSAEQRADPGRRRERHHRATTSSSMRVRRHADRARPPSNAVLLPTRRRGGSARPVRG
jgi:hypothetical protein